MHTDSAPSGLKHRDTVRVTGKVKGSREGKNAFGATIRAVEVDATSVELANNEGSKGGGGATVRPKGR